jgi:hypothetical protein
MPTRPQTVDSSKNRFAIVAALIVTILFAAGIAFASSSRRNESDENAVPVANGTICCKICEGGVCVYHKVTQEECRLLGAVVDASNCQ